MDGRGRCKDDIWIECFWRTIKQEYVYLNLRKEVAELRSGIAKFTGYYNYKRPHQSLELLLPVRQYGDYSRCLTKTAEEKKYFYKRLESKQLKRSQTIPKLVVFLGGGTDKSETSKGH